MPGPDRAHDAAEDLALLLQAAAAAGPIALGHWKSDPQVWDKDDGAGPVSEGDLAVNAALEDHLRSARPAYGWLSEESEADPNRLSAARTFVIDPIDGTRAYLDGQANWAISLAVVEAGTPIAAAIAMPAKSCTYAAVIGGGATRNAAPIRANMRTDVGGATVLTPRVTLDAANWPGGVPDINRHFRPSLAYRMALVAEGRFDAMITLRDAWEWDIAAGALIAAEAGAEVSDRTGAPLVFNSAGALTPGVVTAANRVHQGLLARLM
ncbi:MAG: 3'(2'),5'-bisphosphate nucleotidase CysQ [Rhodobacteraceae bacterium]|nr:3'(2'),5'-bisphosphate nucleotidase CysQ [Paracoccaceae bacterium]